MSAFEYLSVLISIILALGMTRVLAGVGEMLQTRSHPNHPDQLDPVPDSGVNTFDAAACGFCFFVRS